LMELKELPWVSIAGLLMEGVMRGGFGMAEARAWMRRRQRRRVLGMLNEGSAADQGDVIDVGVGRGGFAAGDMCPKAIATAVGMVYKEAR